MTRPTVRQVVGGLLVACVIGFLALPILVTIAFSFNASPRLSFPIEGLTLDWYDRGLRDPMFRDALRNSVVAAVVTALVAALIGVPASFALRGLLLPAIVPALLLGIALTVFLEEVGLGLSLETAIIGHVLIALPFVVLSMVARLDSFDFSIVEAARSLGAGPARGFADIVLPLIRPSIVGAMLLSMALSLDEFVVTFFTRGGDDTLPVLIWGLLRRGIDPTINALATLILAGTVTLALIANRLTKVRL
jgi:spermidine/putrescine transport system permease protein